MTKDELRQEIFDNIKPNARREITGEKLQKVLLDSVEVLGTESDPVFMASPAASITGQDIYEWDGYAQDISDLRSAYAGLTQSDIAIVATLPASGTANTIYRVTGVSSYSDYMWNGTTWVLLATYNNAVDAVPTEGSPNLVESGGVYGVVQPLADSMAGVTHTTTDITALFSFADSYYINANSGHTNFGRPSPTSLGLKASYMLNISSYVGKTLRMTFVSVDSARNFGACFYSANNVDTVVAGIVFPLDAGQQDTFAPYVLEVLIQPTWNYLRTTYFTASSFPTAPAFSAEILDSTSRGTLQEQIDELADTIDGAVDGKVDVLIGKNIFTDANSISGYLNSAGSVVSHATWRVSDYLPVESLRPYHISIDGDKAINTQPNTNVALYDESKQLISGAVYDSTIKDITTPATARYIRVSFKPSQKAVQIEAGTERTAYEEYSKIGGYLSGVRYFNNKELLMRSNPSFFMPPAIKTLGAVCFIWDDGQDDEQTVALFEQYGAKCGFALIGSDGFGFCKVNTMYQELQHKGFSCLNHNNSTTPLSDYATEAEARDAVLSAKRELEAYGLIVNGFVSPNNVYVSGYRTMLGAYHAYAFGDHGYGDGTGVMDVNTRTQDILRLRRWSIENESKTLQDIKNIVDAACANGYLVCFYGHSSRIGTTGYHSLSFYEDVLEYIQEKVLTDLLYFDAPDMCIRYYFNLL